jgi:hypothetical protein
MARNKLINQNAGGGFGERKKYNRGMRKKKFFFLCVVFFSFHLIN